MTRVWVFVDEYGDTKFGANNSRFFGLGAITTDDPERLAGSLDAIRHAMWSADHLHGGWFHAKEDCWEVRRAVYAAFASAPILRCDVVSITKEKVYPSLRAPDRLYGLCLGVLSRYCLPQMAHYDTLTVVAARLDPLIPDLRPILRHALTTSRPGEPIPWAGPYDVLQAPAAAHAGLQMADYLAWACHRAQTRQDHQWLNATIAQG
jgi:hypothetical protein